MKSAADVRPLNRSKDFKTQSPSLAFDMVRQRSNTRESLRILALANSYWMPGHILGGGDRRAIQILKEVQKQGAQVKVMTSGDGVIAYGQHLTAQYQCIGKAMIGKYPFGLMVSYVLRVLLGLRALLTIGPNNDIIYVTTDFFPDVLPTSFFRVAFPGVRWIQVVHHLIPPPGRRPGNFFVNFSSYAAQRISLSLVKLLATRIVVTNHGLKRELTQLGFKDEKMRVSGSGINLDYLSQIQPTAQAFDAVFLGHLRSSKAVSLLIMIWKKVNETLPDAKLGIIGSGPSPDDLAFLKAEISRNELTRTIIALGPLNDTEAFGVVKASKVFLNPSTEEGWSLATAEAIACGVPALAWDLPVYHELYGDSMITVPKLNIDKFAEQTIVLLTNQKARTEYGKELAARVVKLASWKEIAESEFRLSPDLIPANYPRHVIAFACGLWEKGALVGGGDVRAIQILKGFQSRGFKVTVVTPNITDTPYSREFEVTLLPIADRGVVGLAGNYILRIFSSQLLRIPARSDDVIFSTSDHLTDVIPAFVLKLTKGCRWLGSVYHTVFPPGQRSGQSYVVNLLSFVQQRISHVLLALAADAINTETARVVNEFRFAHSSKAPEFVVTSGGVEPKYLRSETASRVFDACYLGRIHPSKGVFDLVRAWPIVLAANPNRNLIIAGTGLEVHVEQLHKLIAQLGLDRSIVLTGMVSESRKHEILAQSKILVHPSYEEGIPITFFEAMAHGVVVLAYFLPSYVELRNIVITVPLKNHALLGSTLGSLLSSPRMLSDYSERSIKFAAEHTWEMVASAVTNAVLR